MQRSNIFSVLKSFHFPVCILEIHDVITEISISTRVFQFEGIFFNIGNLFVQKVKDLKDLIDENFKETN